MDLLENLLCSGFKFYYAPKLFHLTFEIFSSESNNAHEGCLSQNDRSTISMFTPLHGSGFNLEFETLFESI